jgi:uncharacterized phage protein (TIGR02220 family)
MQYAFESLKKNYTNINEPARLFLNLSRDEYGLCTYVQFRSADPRQKIRGWCCDIKEEIAKWVGVTRPGLYKMVDRLLEQNLLEADAKGNLAVTAYWVDVDNECKLSLQNPTEENVNLVYTDRKLSLQKNAKNVNLVTLNKELDISITEKEYCAEGNPQAAYQVEVFEPVKTETVTVEQSRVKVLMPKYDLKKHPLPELEAQRKKLLEQYNDPNTPIHNRAAIEATGKKVAALIKTEKDIDAAILLLNEKAGFTYRLNTPATRKAIKNRLGEYTLENLALVVEHKCKEWADDEKMRQYLRPETLFNGHFESYYQAALIAKKSPPKPKGQVYERPKNLIGQ